MVGRIEEKPVIHEIWKVGTEKQRLCRESFEILVSVEVHLDLMANRDLGRG